MTLKEKLKGRENLHLARLRDRLWEGIKDLEVVRFSHPDYCLPNTLYVGFRGLIGEEVLKAMPAICASTGAACHSGQVSLSHVLSAMGVTPEVGKGAVRFSVGYPTTEEEIEEAIKIIKGTIA